MATEKRITRKQLLNEPDEFLTTSSKIVEFINKNKALAIGAVCGFFLIIASILLIQSLLKKSEMTSFSLLSQATEKYRASLGEGDFQKAFLNVTADFENILDKYPSKTGGKLALMTYAGICMEAGKIDKAIGLYKQALEKFKDAPSVKNTAQNALAYAFEEKKDYQTATVWFELLAADEKYTMKDEALFNLGRLYETLGEMEKSAAAFKRVLEEFPNSSYVKLIKSKTAGSMGS